MPGCVKLRSVPPVVVFAVATLTLLPAPLLAQTRETPPDRSSTIVVTGIAPPTTYTANTTGSFGATSLALREAPQSVQVLTRDLIDHQGVLSLAELLGNVAGASNSLGRSTPFGTATTQIRGQDVLIYRDGLRDVDFSDIDSSALNNVERIDVLKGAAGLNFGSGGPGGVLNIVTKRPLEKFYGEVKLTVGQRNTKILAADVSVPLGSGLGFRATGEIERSDSFIQFSEIERDNFGLVLAYDSGPFRATARYERQSNRDDNAMTRVGLPVLGTIVASPAVAIDRSTYLGEPSFDFTRSFGSQASLFLAYDLSSRFTVEAAARRATVNFEQNDIRTLGALNPTTLRVVRTRARALDLDSTQTDARILAKLRIPGASGDSEFAIGYEFVRQDLRFVNRAVPNAAVPSISVVAPTYLAGGLQATLGPAVPFAQLADAHEFFAQGVVRVGKATLTGAVRHIRSEFDRTSKLSNTVYQIGASYALTESVSAFVGANSGFNANADIAASRNRLGVRFQPESFRQVEGGIKTTLLAGVTATASLFSLTRDDILVTDPVDAAFLIQGGRERSRGGEIDLVWAATPSLTLRGGYAYLDAKIVADADPARIGLRRPNAPEHQFNLFGSYTLGSGLLERLRLGAGVVHSGSTFAAITNTIVRPAYTAANFTASYPVGRYRFDLIASNAFDERYFLARNNAQVNAGEPRQFLFRALARF